MKWTREEYEQAVTRINASKARFLRANSAGGEASNSKPERAARHEPLAEASGAVPNARRLTVCITSFRRKLLDCDNLYGGSKYFVDGLRYAALIPDDREQDIDLQVRQIKVKSRNSERTEIELT